MRQPPTPSRQHLAAYEVLPAMKREADYLLTRTPGQLMVLAIIGGMFLTLAALFGLLLSDGVETPGIRLLLQGLGLSTGFFMIVLARAALFTEANVILPASFLQGVPRSHFVATLRFWGIALIGNILGAIVFGLVIAFAQTYPDSVRNSLEVVISQKLAFEQDGTATAWFRVVVAGMLGNGLIGMAAFFAIMANTLFGKFVPVFLVVTLFVAAGFQHAPANMGFFSLFVATGGSLDWSAAIWWSLVPVGIGNILGGALLVALPFWYALVRETE